MSGHGAPEAAAPAREPYITDIPFPSSYVDTQAPTHMSCAAAMRGFRPPSPSGDYGYCELGCGCGLTLNSLAAANPQARFFGVDFNAEHIRIASSTARAAALDNVTYVEASFDELAAHDLPDFDFIATQGTYSWVGPEVDDSMIRFVDEKLKAGGLFYADYMALPGKAALAPLWHLLRTLTRNHPGNSGERMREGLQLVDRLIDDGARYFQTNPLAAQILKGARGAVEKEPQHVNAVAHHALSEYWCPRYCTEVAAAFAAAGLRFAGSANLAVNDLDLVIPPPLRPFFDELDDPSVIELVKDYVINQQQRQDVFIKDGTADPAGAATFIRSEVFLLPRAAASTVRSRVEQSGAIGDDLLEALLPQFDRGLTCLADIERTPELQGFEPQRVLEAFTKFLAVDLFVICARRPPDDIGPVSTTRGLSVPLPLNRALLREGPGPGRSLNLMSPVAGGGTCKLNIIEVALLDALADSQPDKVLRNARERLQDHKAPIQVPGGKVRPDQIDLQGLQQVLRQLQRTKLQLLARLDVIKSR